MKTIAVNIQQELNERIEQILKLNAKLVKPGCTPIGNIAEDAGELEAILNGLKNISEELDTKTKFIEERTMRLNAVVDVLLEYTLMDFSKKIIISERGDELDAVALGLNTLGEELDSHIGLLKEKTNDLTRSNKQLEEFVYIASHDLQEPLKTLTNYTNLLREELDGKLGDNSARYLDKLTSATDRMRSLIIDLLEYARVGQDAVAMPVDCNSLVTEIISDMSASITDSGATVQVHQLPNIKGNYSELKSLFQNLISNAIKFKRAGVQPVVQISATEDENNYSFTIQDNGIGIEERFHDRIFSIFQKLHSRKLYQGTGIGLAHCKKVVEHHRGTIWLRSEPGIGTTFYFTIPKIKT